MSSEEAPEAGAPFGEPGGKGDHLSVPRVTFGSYDDEATVTCRACGWTGRGFECGGYRHWRDAVEVLCPSCEAPLVTVGFPGVSEELSADLRAARLPDGRPLPQVPKGLCPWCGSTDREPADEEWWCRGCSERYPTGAYKCRVPTCWGYNGGGDYCERHEPQRTRGA